MINISLNAVSAHQAHGDAVDMDGDGYYDIENECMDIVDCDDTDPELNVSCDDPCLDEAINQVSDWIEGQGGIILNVTKTSSNTFLIFWDNSGVGGRGCTETTAEATGDPETGCGYTILQHNSPVPCP